MITTGNFNAKLQNLVINAKSQRESVQELIVFGVMQYALHSDTGYLTRLMQACVGVKALPTQTIKDYIKEHANVKYVAIQDKETKRTKKVFKKDGERAETKDITVSWYEWHGARHQASLDLDETAQIRSFLTRLNAKIKDGHVKNFEHAVQVKQALESLPFLKKA